MKKRGSLLKFLLALVTLMLIVFSCTVNLSNSNKSTDNTGLNDIQKSSAVVNIPNVGRLTGVNWFGFETGNYVAHGLWTRDYKSMLQQIADLGFNCIRIPWCNEMLDKTPSSIQINEYGVDGYTGITGMNMDLEGLSSIEVLDKIIEESERLGLKIILDNHSRSADGYMNETLWYTDSCPESKWISDWVFMINRYKNQGNVIGADLNNEPHGNTGMGMKPPATWGYDEPGYGVTDWKNAAEKCAAAILNANPSMIIMVEGVEEAPSGETYWWGGNLKGVGYAPITSIPKNNLVYSPHEYGPGVYNQTWFSDPDFPNNMPAIWDEHFWFIYKEDIAPLLFGEFGIEDSAVTDPSSTAYIWFTEFMKYVGYKSSWTFWCMNPNSGDTGGILNGDWVTVNQAKYNLLKPYLEPFNSSSSSISSSSSSSSSSSISSSSSSSSSSQGTYITITVPYTQDGSGIYKYKTSSSINYINSWNLDSLTINGLDITNTWIGGSNLPAKQDGYYYIDYEGSFPWSHAEIK